MSIRGLNSSAPAPRAALPNLGTAPAPTSEARNPTTPTPPTPPTPTTPAAALTAHEGLLHHLARRAGAGRLSPEDCADILQDMRLAFARAWDTADRTRTEKEILVWSALHARRAASNWFRHRNQLCRAADLTSADAPLPGGSTLLDFLPAAPGPEPMLAHEMAQAVRTLTGRRHAVITRHYFEGELFTHIADTWGVSRVRVHQIHAEAMQTLRKYFSTTENTDEHRSEK